MINYQTSFEEGDVVILEQEFVTIQEKRYKKQWEYLIKGKWKDAAVVDRNAVKSEVVDSDNVDI